MEKLDFNTAFQQFNEHERLVKEYNNLYELFAVPGFNVKDMNEDDRAEIDGMLKSGVIGSLEELGNFFDILSDRHYKEARQILKTKFK